MLKINNNTCNSPNFRGFTVGPKAAKTLDKIGAMQSPSQRLIFGASALALHPILDKLNPWVDEETRNTSAKRSAAKAIACTVTGVTIREACILGTNALLNNKNLVSKLPKYMLKDKSHTAGVIGTLMGLGIMVFTNFIIDVPLTNKLTNMFTKKSQKNIKNTNNEQKQAPSPEIKTPSPTFSNYERSAMQASTITNAAIVPNAESKTNVFIETNTASAKAALSQINTEVINGRNK